MSNVFKDNSDNLAALASALLAKDMSIVESNRRAADEAILFHKDAIALSCSRLRLRLRHVMSATAISCPRA